MVNTKKVQTDKIQNLERVRNEMQKLEFVSNGIPRFRSPVANLIKGSLVNRQLRLKSDYEKNMIIRILKSVKIKINFTIRKH